SITLSGEFYYDFFNGESIPQLSNILRECYLSIYPDWGDIKIGQKFTNKGKVDVFSPLNIFNASYRELLSLDEPYQGKLPELGVEVNYFINDENSLELVYIPFPRSDYQSSGELDVNDLNLTLLKTTDSYLTSHSNSFFITYNKYGYLFDAQVTYGNYIDGNYNYNINTNNSGISKIFNRVQTLGAAISTSFNSVSVVEEVAFNLTEDFYGDKIGIKNSDFTMNTQFTKSLLGNTYSQINIIYQHVFNYSKAESNSIQEAIYDIQLQPTDNIVFIIGHLHNSFLREKLYAALNLGFFFSTNIYVAPRLNYKINDNLTLESGLDIYTGKYIPKLLEEDLGGDNFFVRMKYEL
ncbi:MAG: hypothetical protein JXR64_09810, partial [Spirochaetales bacterium]|nr:hypothetical protein [Spirochaetales bacterium]